MAIEIGIRDLNIYSDLQLVINQLVEEYEVKKEHFILYHKHALWLLNKLDLVKLEYMLRVPIGWLTHLQASHHFGTGGKRRNKYPSM